MLFALIFFSLLKKYNVMQKFLLTFLFTFTLAYNYAQIAQWRGANRDGIFNETGLLKQWGDNGPKLLWHYDNLGPGHASAAVTDERIYTAGTTPEEIGFVIALDFNGNMIWETEFGKEWMENWNGVRSTPLVYNDKIYIMSSFGKLVCMTSDKGEILWTKDLFTEFGGLNIQWGVTENLLIDDNKLFVTVGGTEYNVVALNKDNGELIWKCKGNGEKSAYGSPAVINHNGRKILIAQTEFSVLGIDALKGDLLWTFDHRNQWSVMANTPIYHNGMLYIVSGYGKGGDMLKLSDDGSSVTKVWSDTNLDSKMGAAVLVDGKIYGSGDKNNKWFCVDWNTGNLLYSDNFIKKGNICFADGLLYCYGEDGKVALVEPTENSFNVISKFTVPYGEEYHWAYLVIHNKKLYLRHGTSLMVYDISAN